MPSAKVMKRFLVLLAVAALGFVIGSATYLVLEPYLPSLPDIIGRLLAIASQPWFLAGIVGAILAIALILIWANSGSDFGY